MTGPDEHVLDSVLTVRREVAGSMVVVTLTGELDLSTLPQAEREILAAEDTAPAVLLVDLSGLGFMDSSAVRLVLQADARAHATGRRLAVACGRGLPRQMFDLLGLDDRLELVDGPEEIR
jgi:anti-sigma B factor antagonist